MAQDENCLIINIIASSKSSPFFVKIRITWLYKMHEFIDFIIVQMSSCPISMDKSSILFIN